MLDASALNAHVLYVLKNPTSDNRARRLKLGELAINLIKPHVLERVELARSNRFSGYDTNLITSFKRLGFNVQVDVPSFNFVYAVTSDQKKMHSLNLQT